MKAVLGRYGVTTWPAMAVFAVFFVIPMGYFFIISFWGLKHYKLKPGFSFHNYLKAYEQYLDAGIFTFSIALGIAILTTAIAFALAYLIRFKAGRFGPLLLFVTMTTMFGGYLVKIYAWKTILGKHGILNELLISIGLITEPLYWILYNPIAVVLTLVHFLLPFAILPIYSSLRSISDVPVDAARDLGASSRRTLVDIILPQCQPGLFAAFALAFLIAAGDYVTPRLVGGPQSVMIGNFIESQFVNRMNTPIGSALSYSVLTACVATLVIFRGAMRTVLRPR